MESQEQATIEAIRVGDQHIMKKLYLEYRDEFCNWLKKKYSMDNDGAIDMYQEAVTTFFEKTKRGDLAHYEGDVKNYIFGIGKNKMLQLRDDFAKNNRHAIYLSEHFHFIAQDEERSWVFEDAFDIAKDLMRQMGEPCKALLQDFYFYNMNMEQIAEKFGYKSEGVARTTKKRCMQKMRALVFKDDSNE